MTQVIGRIDRGHIFQASDRQLSWESPGVATTTPADLRSNKAVVAFTRDAVLAVGYSGTAEVEGIPTDDWIAGAICSVGRRSWVTASSGHKLHEQTASMVINTIRWRLDALLNSMPRPQRDRFYLTIQVVGSILKNGQGIQPVAWEMTWRPRRSRSIVSFTTLPADATYNLLTPSRKDTELRTRMLAALDAPAESPSAALQSLATAMQYAAERPDVGDLWLGIDVDLFASRVVLNYATLGQLDRFEVPGGTVSVMWLPWILSDFLHLPPSHATACTRELPRGFKLVVCGPDPIVEIGNIGDNAVFSAALLVQPRDRTYDVSEDPVVYKFPALDPDPHAGPIDLARRAVRFVVHILEQPDLRTSTLEIPRHLLGALTVPELAQSNIIACQILFAGLAKAFEMGVDQMDALVDMGLKQAERADLGLAPQAFDDGRLLFNAIATDPGSPVGSLDLQPVFDLDFERGCLAGVALLWAGIAIRSVAEECSPVRAAQVFDVDLEELERLQDH